jgi:PEGA domain
MIQRLITILGLLLVCTVLPGCLTRHVSVTSEPSGATVYANDVELGRTPLTAAFTYYGSYDVRVEMEGYEPSRMLVYANAPIYEYPPFDLIAIAMPWTIDHTVKWHFKLEPSLESTQSKEDLDKGMLDRAHQLRAKIDKTE